MARSPLGKQEGIRPCPRATLPERRQHALLCSGGRLLKGVGGVEARKTLYVTRWPPFWTKRAPQTTETGRLMGRYDPNPLLFQDSATAYTNSVIPEQMTSLKEGW